MTPPTTTQLEKVELTNQIKGPNKIIMTQVFNQLNGLLQTKINSYSN